MTETDTVPNPITTALARMTTSERTILRAIVDHWAVHNTGPILRELGEAAGVSTSSAYGCVVGLKALGLVTSDRYEHRSIRAVEGVGEALALPAATEALEPRVAPAEIVEALKAASGPLARRGLRDDRAVTVIAQDLQELLDANAQLGAWCQAKQAAALEEIEHADEVIAQAKAAKLSVKAITRLRRLAQRRFEYYEKLGAALEAGYTMLPPLGSMAQRTVIAIRTDEEPTVFFRENARQYNGRWNLPQRVERRPPGLPMGEGQCLNPAPDQFVETWQETKDGKAITMAGRRGRNRWRVPELPVEMCRPQLISALDRAASLAVFDEIVVVGIEKKKPDPILCGLVHHHSIVGKGHWDPRAVWFLLGWWIDTRTLE